MTIVHKDSEFRAKVIKLRKEGKKWEEVAKAVGVSLNAVHQYHKRKWYVKGMEGKKEPEVILKKEPEVIPKKEPEVEPPDVVGKTKKKAQKQVDQEVEKHLQTSDKKPPGTPQKKEEDKTSTTDKTTPKPKSKGGGVWFLVAILVAVVVIAVVFLILRPKPEERAEYQKPAGGEKEPSGFEGRRLEDL